ncbi:hypothetical protein AWR36_011580 [Microbulbifer flavimaris]|uniref:Uncharacterized protein n=1 Tax=Microbulbifer flavimaris TaxID=1781068 RepID=A0ABX4HX06_9GAMM|nr:hypothetical protein AVO43_11540 [Microbulbifer sp. ZGT114]PCO04649.1 hypothetical protein AWR36_011580 [Microbulbifer flavimaris]
MFRELGILIQVLNVMDYMPVIGLAPDMVTGVLQGCSFYRAERSAKFVMLQQVPCDTTILFTTPSSR